MFFASLRRQSAICTSSYFVKNDRGCKANVLNDRDNHDGVMVFEVSSALCVGNYRCCRSMSCVYSEVYNEKHQAYVDLVFYL